MREIKLSSDNCMTIIRSIAVGAKDMHATYKNNKGRKRVMVQLGEIPDNWSDEQLDNYLKDCKIIVPAGFIEYPA